MSEKVPRFEFRCPCDMGGYTDAERIHEPDGDYVEHADYEALQRELRAYAKDAEAMKELLRESAKVLNQYMFSDCGSYNNEEVIDMIERIDAHFRGDAALSRKAD